jgi:RimJ/RimL family protein N-acetyltransferase
MRVNSGVGCQIKGRLIMKVLETDRLILRHLTVEDSEFILELLNDPSWLRFIGDRGVKTLDDARDYILKSLVPMYERLGFGMYLTELKSDGVSVGICGLIKRDSLADVDVGFAFLPKFRGKGYAYESASAVMEYGKKSFALNRIAAITSPDNNDSARLLEKLGFKFERMVKLSDDSAEVSLFTSEV